jgi:hypothetical protein
VQPNVLNAVGIKNISDYEWTTTRMCSVAHAHQHLAQLDVLVYVLDNVCCRLLLYQFCDKHFCPFIESLSEEVSC